MSQPVPERLAAVLADRYRIDREIGAGGMATVYLAHDLKHERQVALKVLKPELGAVLGLERFLSEIKVTANLQHPNLLPLFDSGEADGLLFYVMPFVEGESLRAALDREKQFPVDEAVRIAVAVANALAYAHGQGIIHRDLKPENILLQAGQPVIADFGIALAVSKAGGARITQTGLSLGTPMYMSPEQATGDRAIDGRTDLYSLAAMTYEMLTGEPPHIGTSSQAIIAKLMTEAPRPLTLLRPNVPPHVNAAVLRALEKLPADRFTGAREFAVALTTPGAGPTSAGTALNTATALPTRRSTRAALAAMAGVTLAAVGLAAWTLSRGSPSEPTTRVALAFSDSTAPYGISPFAVSPDGNLFAYFGRGPNSSNAIWIKARDRAAPTVLAATVSAQLGIGFAFSPDSKWIAYTHGSKLEKTPIVGGTGIVLADSANGGRGIAWLDDGSVVFEDRLDAMRRVSANGGLATRIMARDSGSLWLRPIALPNARGVLFVRCSPSRCALGEYDLWVLDLASGTSHELVRGAASGWYSPTGHIVYLRPDGALLAVPFDLSALAVKADAVPVQDSVGITNDFARALPQFAFSPTGIAMMGLRGSMSLRTNTHRLVWVNRAGQSTPVDTAWGFRPTVSGTNPGVAISPDGRRIAIGLYTSSGDDIWIKELASNTLSRLTFDSAAEFRPRWSRDGKRVGYTRQWATGEQSLASRAADFTGTDEVILPRRKLGATEHAFSPDGKYLVIRTGDVASGAGRDISIMEIGVDSVPRPLIADPAFDESAFALSPDGHWIAYEANLTGKREVYVRPFPNVNAGSWQLSNGGGRAALWSRKGNELYFVNPARDMMAAAIAPVRGTPGIGAITRLFHLRDEWWSRDEDYYTPHDIAPDGRFVMLERIKTDDKSQLSVVFVDHWLDELRRKVGKK